MKDIYKQENNNIQQKPDKKASLLLPIIVAAAVFAVMVVSIAVSAAYNPLTEVEEKSYYRYNIESVELKDDRLVILGWFFEQGKSTVELGERDSFPEMCIVLQSQGGQPQKVYYPETVSRQPRSDVNEYFSSSYDYTNCGFYAIMNISDMDDPNGVYEILIMPDKNGTETIKTSNYLNNMQWQY